MPLLPPNPKEYSLESIFALGTQITDWVLGFAVGLGVIAVLYGAIQYFSGATSGGEDKSQKGKNIILWAVIGIAVVLLSKIILRQFVNIADLNPVNVPPGADIVKEVI